VRIVRLRARRVVPKWSPEQAPPTSPAPLTRRWPDGKLFDVLWGWGHSISCYAPLLIFS
jgi:hypothetical protein